MIMKKLVVFIAVIFTAIPIFSQYSAGILKVGLGMGNSPYVSLLNLDPPDQSNSSHSLYPTWESGTNGSLVNMIGMELKYFIADGFACKLMGGGQFSTTPGQVEIEGVQNGPFDPQKDIPSFAEIAEQKYYQYLVQVGADFYIQKSNAAIYGGLEAGIRYGGRSTTSINENSAGSSIYQVFGHQYAIVFGAEYGMDQSFFAGVEIRPVSLSYLVSKIEPIPGVSMSGDNLTWGFFVYPMLRFGINF
jgi:hypothetical protein